MGKTTKDRSVIKQKLYIILMLLLCFFITACGKQADTDHGIEDAEEGKEKENIEEIKVKEDETVTENGISENEEITESATEEDEVRQPEENNVIEAYLTENIEYVDTVVPVQYTDDLSLIEDMKYGDGTYAYQDGKIYYRRYHEDSFEETALWGNYYFTPETRKEIVCIDSDGRETELFADAGYGEIYLLHDRFYMTDAELREEDGSLCREQRLYSVDMQGNDRIDYGDGEILVIDREKKILIFEVRKEDVFQYCYYILNYETGEQKPLNLDINDDDSVDIKFYQDGWLYYEEYKWGNAMESRLCAVSLEGEKKEIIALTSDINQGSQSYVESILRTEVDGDRIYFIFGGYDGSANVFQGGLLISIKSDGTDYKAVSVSGEYFYLCHKDGKTLVYFEPPYLEIEDPDNRHDIWVWDVDADICYSSEFPMNILYAYYMDRDLVQWYSGDKEMLCETMKYDESGEEKTTNIYAIPDDSGKIVRVAMNLEDYIPKWENEEIDLIQYEDLYYADGFLYFTVEYSAYDEETAIGWRDGYRRLRSDVYRLKVGENTAGMLYSY